MKNYQQEIENLVNNNNNEELPTRKRISSSRMMCKYCKYPAIAILVSGFMYSLFAIGIYVGEVISDYTSILLINHQRNGRTKYGYLHPTPPYKPVIRISHTCNITSIKNNETIQEVVHLAVATPHLILIGAQKSGTSSFQSMIDKRINVITPLSVDKFEPHFFDWQVKKYSRSTMIIQQLNIKVKYAKRGSNILNTLI